MKIETRNYGIDIVRIIATITVLCVHFFLNTGYYEYVKDADITVVFHIFIRNFFMICVPLFMLITGYLNKKIEYNKSFFKGLLNILIVWFFYSIIEYVVLNLINGYTDNLNIKDFIKAFTSFNACGYSWYIEMYIGLYLLSPILNNSYNSFNKKNRLYLLLICAGIFILPQFINEIWNGFHLPSWWTSAYPIAYYIFGKYIFDIKPKFNKKTLFFILVLMQLIAMFIDLNTSIEYYTITTFISSTIVFLLFYDIEIKNKTSQKVIKYISNISLDIYLASSLIDKILYPIFNNYMANNNISSPKSLIYSPLIILIVFICSAIYGSIRKFIINVR